MSQFIGKSLIVALLIAQATGFQGQAAVPQELPSPPRDPVCYDYYLKMHDIVFGTLEYVMKRNKILEVKCGAYHRVDPDK